MFCPSNIMIKSFLFITILLCAFQYISINKYNKHIVTIKELFQTLQENGLNNVEIHEMLGYVEVDVCNTTFDNDLLHKFFNVLHRWKKENLCLDFQHCNFNKNIDFSLLQNIGNVLGLTIAKSEQIPIQILKGVSSPNLIFVGFYQEERSILTKEESELISTCCNISELRLTNIVVSNETLLPLSKLKIDCLWIDMVIINDDTIAVLLNFEQLISLNINSVAITDSILTRLSKLPLKDIQISNSSISEKGLQILTQWKTLREISLFDNKNIVFDGTTTPKDLLLYLQYIQKNSPLP